MKITKMRINRFGRFSDADFTLPDHPFLIIYGPNEAGKSTLKTFINHMLFGFPQKGKLEPYLERNGIDPGGSLVLDTQQFSSITLERRLANKKEPRIYMANGEIKPISHIQKLFHGIDRSIFEAIFCFDLDGLQGLEKIGPDELNHFLFSAGMMGSTKLFQLEQSLDKRLAELFKPSGRRPIINQLLAECDQKREEMKSWEKKLDRYHDLQHLIHENRKKLATQQRQKRNLEERNQQFAQYMVLKPLIIAFQTINDELKQLIPQHTFPEKGLERFEKWQAQAIPLEGEIAEAARKIEQIDQTLTQQSFDEKWLAEERNLVTLIQKSRDMAYLKEDLQVLNEKCHQAQQKLNDILQRLGGEWSPEKVSQAITGLEVKDHLKSLLSERQKVTSEKGQHEASVNQSLSRRRDNEEKIKRLKSRQLSDERRRQIESKLAQTGDEEGLIREKDWLEQQLETVRIQKKQADKLKKTGLVIGVAGTLLSIFLALTVSLFIQPISGLLLGGTGLLISTVFVVFMLSSSAKTGPYHSEAKTAQRLKDVDDLLSQPKEDLAALKDSLEEDLQVVTTLHMEEERMNEEKRLYEQAITKLDKAVLHFEMNEQGLAEWLRENGFLQTTRYNVLEDIYQLVEEGKAASQLIEQYGVQIKEREQRIGTFETTKKQLAQRLNVPEHDIAALQKELALQKEKYQTYTQRLNQKKSLIEQKEALEDKVERFYRECRKIMEVSGVSSEEAFRQAAERDKRRRMLLTKRSELKYQMSQAASSEEVLERCFSWFETGEWTGTSEASLRDGREKIERTITALNQQLIDWQSELRHLEENQMYTELQYGFEETKALLNEKARQWTVYKAAQTLLHKAKENYRHDKLPKVLKQASSYFAKITSGAYQSIYLTEDFGFAVQREDGTGFHVTEISRGTKEQLYLSLRLALASMFETKDKFPIIIDDSLVNTDPNRHKQVMTLLNDVAKKHQVILFTCHKDRYKGHPSEAWVTL
ncbi:uncharacterized protein YhaN [Scopulibacillus darangshiensis]|uniref:Uncharacterized protein YhaN n=1 Tax=Scopulibacillus darangshiensis TaxID=442528 RepID=A0A4V2SN00_9BACL|nr:AAA family ATPase [Scopulibacillus darangshiensis]TCP29286.1 uncharacterized protein YhaN [Scopulibacillus darangshiensis]